MHAAHDMPTIFVNRVCGVTPKSAPQTSLTVPTKLGLQRWYTLALQCAGLHRCWSPHTAPCCRDVYCMGQGLLVNPVIDLPSALVLSYDSSPPVLGAGGAEGVAAGPHGGPEGAGAQRAGQDPARRAGAAAAAAAAAQGQDPRQRPRQAGRAGGCRPRRQVAPASAAPQARGPLGREQATGAVRATGGPLGPSQAPEGSPARSGQPRPCLRLPGSCTIVGLPAVRRSQHICWYPAQSEPASSGRPVQSEPGPIGSAGLNLLPSTSSTLFAPACWQACWHAPARLACSTVGALHGDWSVLWTSLSGVNM